MEDIGGDPGEEWISYDAEMGAWYLCYYGLDTYKPYVMTHRDGIYNDWEMCHQ